MSKSIPTTDSSSDRGAGQPRLLVVVGAAEGGIESLQAMLPAIHAETTATYVIVLAADSDSATFRVKALSEHCPINVVSLFEPTAPQPGTVYVIPPGYQLEQADGRLATKERPEQTDSGPIDASMIVAAGQWSHNLVGVVLSGKGSDGSEGLQQILDVGGSTMVETPKSASCPEMPTHAIERNLANQILAPPDMPVELAGYQLDIDFDQDGDGVDEHVAQDVRTVVLDICDALLEATEHDFRHYKQSSLIRRIAHRMREIQITDASEYLDHLHSEPSEAKALFRELLINITSFFRDQATFQRLSDLVLPKLFEQRASDSPVRVWVAGCSTGEEAYTLAMLLLEQRRRCHSNNEIQVFATDVDAKLLNTARAGTYPLSIEQQIPSELLERYFIKKNQQYHVSNELRDLCRFTVHDLVRDPPFSRIDLVSCRNVLIYFGPHLQQKLFSLFHFSLRTHGYLLLGPSENAGSHSEIFRVLDRKHRIAQRKSAPADPSATLASRASSPRASVIRQELHSGGDDVHQVAQRIVLDEFAPRWAVVNEDAHLICNSSNLEQIFEIPAGPFRNSILKMARPGLRSGLRTAFRESTSKLQTIVREDLTINTPDGTQRIKLTVQPMPSMGDDENLFMIVFDRSGFEHRHSELSSNESSDTRSLIERLEAEIEQTRAELEQTVHDLETSNEAMKASNDELRSVNEELKSSNEELEASKEEIEEGMQELDRTKCDLQNLLSSSRIATIFLDDSWRIRFFTPAATEIYDLLETDIGRPLDRFKPLVESMPPMPQKSDIESSNHADDLIRTAAGKWFLRRVLPYQSAAPNRSGVVITFNDVTELQAARMDTRDREQQLRSITDSIPPLIAHIAPDETYRFVNLAYAEHYRSSPDEMIGRSVREVIGKGDYDSALPNLRRGLRGERFKYDLPLLSNDRKQKLQMEVAYVPQIRDDGTSDGCIVIVTDVTERHRSEMALLEGQRKLELALTAGHLGAWQWDISSNTITWSESLYTTLKYTQDEFDLTFDAFVNLVHPDDRRSVQMQIEAALRDESANYEVQCRMLRGDGSYCWILGKAIVLRDGHAKPLSMTGVASDITERHEAEMEIRRSNAKLRVLFDQAFYYTGLIDTNGILTDINDAALDPFGYTREMTIGLPFWETPWWHGHPDSQNKLRTNFATALAGNVYREELTFRGPDGSVRYSEFVYTPAIDDDGNVLFIVATGSDVTERHDYQASLENARRLADEANQAKSEFIANMSHEIRTPMTSILGYADLALEQTENEETRELLATIRRNGKFLLEIINDILDLSKIEAGKMESSEEQFSLVHLIEDVRSIMSVRAKEKGIDLDVTYDGKVPRQIVSDPKQVKQILVNLVGNAIKFTREGSVQVGVAMASHADEKLRIDVTDTGIGVPLEQQERLFQPFTQGDASVSREFGGTGLGLAISKRLAGMLGGTISLESEPGRGSTFTCTIATGNLTGIEMVSPGEGEDAREEVAQRVEACRLDCHVLVVDDRRDIRYLSRRFLTRAGARVTECEDGLEALEMMEALKEKDGQPDCIVLDMQMPRLDGYQTAERLRAFGYNGPIIALTADAMHGDMKRCLQSGCNDYLSKPINAELLIAKVAELTGTTPTGESD